MSLDRLFSIRLSLEQYDKLVNYAASKNSDAQAEIRKWIDSIGSDPEELKKELEYHKYKCETLLAEIERRNGKKPEPEKKEAPKTKKLEINIFKELVTKYKKEYQDEEKAKAVEEIKKDIESQLEKVPEEERLMVKKILYLKTSKMIMNFDKDEEKQYGLQL